MAQGPLIFLFSSTGGGTVVSPGGGYSDSYGVPYGDALDVTVTIPTPTIVIGSSSAATVTPAPITVVVSIPTPSFPGFAAPTLPTLLVEMDLGDMNNAAQLDDPTTLLDVSVLDNVSPTYPEDITSFVRPGTTVDRGTSRELQRVEAGTASMRLDNRDSRFTPFITSSPYYPKVLPMRRIRIRAVWANVTYSVFTGFVESWPVSFPQELDTVVQVALVDGFKMLSLARVSGDFVEQTSGDRVTAILDAVAWPPSERTIDIGQATVPAVILENVSALEHIQQIAHAEGGRFFMAADGKATFKDRSFEAAADIDLRTWTDDGTGMSYRDLTLTFDDSLILNDVHMTRTDGVEMVAVDQHSIDQYGLRSHAESDLQLATDGEVQARADLMAERYGQPDLRVERLVDNAMKHLLWDRVLPRDINDLAKVVESRTETAQVSSIEGIHHDIGPAEWTITLSVAPATITAFSFLDDPSGILDDTAILGR
jgi:hypothetical protein